MKLAVYFLSLFIASAALAQAKVESSKQKENYKDIIKKAQNLTVQKDRLQGAKVIVRVLEHDNLSKKNREELKKALQEISSLFYTEKTQKTFEYAKSLLRDSPQESLDKFKQALAEEPSNVTILLWAARNALYRGKCDEAEAYTSNALAVNPFHSYLQLARLQALACVQKFSEFDKALEEYKTIEAEHPLFFSLVMAQNLFHEKKYSRASSYIEKAKEIDRDYPEIYYWEVQIGDKLGESVRNAVLRFVRGCRILSVADYFKYEAEPRLCQQYKSYENEYKNIIERGKKEFD